MAESEGSSSCSSRSSREVAVSQQLRHSPVVKASEDKGVGDETKKEKGLFISTGWQEKIRKDEDGRHTKSGLFYN